MNHPRRFFRIGWGLLRLTGFVLAAGPTRLWVMVCVPGGSREQKAQWMQILCRRALRILHCRVEVTGCLPAEGLIVANHLGYVDILALGSLMPAAFVAKSSVRAWPVFGTLAAMGGSVFVNRDLRSKVVEPLMEMEAILTAGIRLVLFPEGTSTDGSHVRPFLSSLLAVAESSGCAVTPARIQYSDKTGRPNRKLAYHGNDVFFAHLLAALGAEETVVRVAFGASVRGTNRKVLARQLRESISERLTRLERHRPPHPVSPHISGDTPRP